jgi:hypothetical protein
MLCPSTKLEKRAEQVLSESKSGGEKEKGMGERGKRPKQCMHI